MRSSSRSSKTSVSATGANDHVAVAFLVVLETLTKRWRAKRCLAPAESVRLNEILLAFFTTPTGALAADSVDDHFVAFDPEPVSSGHFVADHQQFVALKLDEFTTACAVQVIVLRVAVIVVVNGAAIELKAIQQPRVDAFAQCAVDRRGADVVVFAASRQTFDEFFSIEVVVLAEDLSDQKLPLSRLPLSSGLEVFGETLFG